MFETLRKSGWTGVAMVVGAAVLAPTVWPALGRAARPAAKSALKAGLVAAEGTRERLAELGEAADDLLAEARHELASERRARAAADAADAAEATAAATPGEDPAADAR